MSETNIRKVDQAPDADVRVVRPRADVYEGPDAHYVLLDVPGVEQNQVALELDQGILRISADRHLEANEYLRYERAFHVPAAIERDAVSATLKAGVLTITLPKAVQAKSRRIEVAAA